MSRIRIDKAARALLEGGSSAPVGAWEYDVTSGEWSWSPEVFAAFGFTPGEVVPTSDLLLAHKEAGTAASDPVDADVFGSGDTFSVHLRIRDAGNRARDVLVLGRAERDEGGAVRVVRGHLVDLTDWRRVGNAADVRDGIDAATEHRSEIEQAKGALMAARGISADEAFAALAKQSQDENVKLRELAARIVRELG